MSKREIKRSEGDKVQSAIASRPGLSRVNFGFRWRYGLLIFLLALSFRGLYLFEASQQPGFDLFYMDEEYNLEWGKSIASGDWSPPYDRLRDAPYFRAPLYSYFLAGLFTLFGESMLLARIVQIIMGSVSCALAYGVGAKCFGQRVGVATGVLCSIYWVLVYFDGEFLLPVLLVFLILLGVLLVFIAVERRSAGLAGLAGLLLGLYAITRPNILLFFPFAIWWSIRLTKSMRAKTAVWFVILLALGCVLPPALATVRNGVVADDWVIVSSQGGVNFYIGNNPKSDGMEAIVPGTRHTWRGGYEDAIAIAEKAVGHPLKSSEVSNYWFVRAFSYIREQPGHWLRLTLRKVIAFVNGVEIPNNEPYEARRQNYWTLRSIPLSFGILFGLFVVSLPLMMSTRHFFRPEKVALGELQRSFISLILQFMLVYALTVIAFFVTGRYRVPLLPFIAMGATVTILKAVDLVRARRVVPAIVIAVISAILVAALSIDYLDVREATRGSVQFAEALVQLGTGDLDGAISGLEAIRKRKSVCLPEVYKSLGCAYFRRDLPGDRQAVLNVAEEGLSYYPDEPELLWYAAVGHMFGQNWKHARERIERFLIHKPNDIRGLHLAFLNAIALGKTQEASQYLSRAEAVDRQHPLVVEMRQWLGTVNP